MMVEGYQSMTITQTLAEEETIYYVEDGEVMKCDRKYSNTFFTSTDKWIKIDEIPLEANFIGLYRKVEFPI